MYSRTFNVQYKQWSMRRWKIDLRPPDNRMNIKYNMPIID